MEQQWVVKLFVLRNMCVTSLPVCNDVLAAGGTSSSTERSCFPPSPTVAEEKQCARIEKLHTPLQFVQFQLETSLDTKFALSFMC